MSNTSAIVKTQSQPWVNVFKGIAILMVLVVHSTHRFELPVLVNEVCKFGQMGCQVFFVISAFCISMSYDRRKEPVCSFYKRRFISIAPGYWITIALNIITVLLTIAVFGYSRRWQNFTFLNVSENFLLLNGFSIGRANNYIVRGGWYIGTTVILYVIFPVLAYIYNRLRIKFRFYSPFVLFAVAFLSLFIAGSFSKALYCTNYSFIYYSFFNQLPRYSLGIVIYDLYKRDEIKRIKTPLLWSVMLLLVSFVFFYVDIPYAFVVEPFVFGLSVAFAICWIMNKPYQYDSRVSIILQSLGGQVIQSI